MKQCRKCDTTKPVAEFTRRNTESSDGLHPWCTNCKRSYERAYRVSNLDRVKAKEKRYREANKEQRLAYQTRQQRREMELEMAKWIRESRR